MCCILPVSWLIGSQIFALGWSSFFTLIKGLTANEHSSCLVWLNMISYILNFPQPVSLDTWECDSDKNIPHNIHACSWVYAPVAFTFMSCSFLEKHTTLNHRSVRVKHILICLIVCVYIVFNYQKILNKFDCTSMC